MSMKDSLIKKLESQIDAWDKEIEAAKAKAREKEAQAETEQDGARLKEEMMDNVHSLQDKIDTAKKKISEIQKAGEERLDELKTQVSDWLNS
jgi:phage I-like protein